MSSEDYKSGAFNRGAQICFPRFQRVRNDTHNALQFLFGNHVPCFRLPAIVNSVGQLSFFFRNAGPSRTPLVKKDIFLLTSFKGS